MNKDIKKELKKDKKEKVNISWIIKIVLIACIISIIFGSLSEAILPNVNIVLGIIIVVLFVGIGVLFDMVGVAVSAASETPVHSMSSRRVSGARTAVKLKKNADKVSTFCNDVIGDICGIVSGSAGAVIALSISSKLHIDPLLTSLGVTGIVAGITVGGKAIEKSFAINRSNEILYSFAKIINIFCKEK